MLKYFFSEFEKVFRDSYPPSFSSRSKWATGNTFGLLPIHEGGQGVYMAKVILFIHQYPPKETAVETVEIENRYTRETESFRRDKNVAKGHGIWFLISLLLRLCLNGTLQGVISRTVIFDGTLARDKL